MDFSVATFADRDLLSVDCAEHPVKACWFSLMRELSDVPDVVHDDLFGTFPADATRFS